jgi:VWFA-related protein
MHRTACIVFYLGLVIAAAALVRAQSAQSRPSSSAPPAPEQDPARKPPPGEPPDAATIKLDTALVVIPVSVLDRDGKYIPNLTRRDFHIYEDDVEQEIAYFSAVEVPFQVVLLLDTSSSARFKIEDIQNAALAFVEQLRPQDRVMVVSFDSRIYVDAEFTSDRAQLRRAIYGIRTRGGTRLYDAVDLALTERLKHLQGRKAIVLFTDGVDTESRLTTAPRTLELVEESGVLVYPVQYDTSRDAAKGARVVGPPGNQIYVPDPAISGPEAYRQASQYLTALAERTGARLYPAETIGNLHQALSLIAEELRHQYAISYYPTNTKRDGSYRRLRVRVDQAGVVVRARPGYRMAQAAPARHQGADRPPVKRDRS